MSLSVSPKMKIVALVGVLAALVLGAASMMLGRSQPDPNAASTVPLRHFKPRVTKSPATPAKPVAAKPKPKRKPAAQPITAPNGLPTALDELLHGHRVVIVALWDPEVPSDR
ncbi:MAG: hypothetical protein QOD13_2925, partial [Thermoleophilaceae bacterium]|nr:hypothetical protein [Thermoleophilaceae bacterium]